MDLVEMTCSALEKNEFVKFLRGDKEYMVEPSQYAPGSGTTDVGEVLSRGIYKVYHQNPKIKQEYETALSAMLKMTNFDVYMVCLYLVDQFFDEENDLSPFLMEKDNILLELKKEINRRKLDFQKGIKYPNGYINNYAWVELERFNTVCKEEYNIKLF